MVNSFESHLSILPIIFCYPVKKIDKCPEEYQWSSFRENALGESRGLIDIEENPIYEQLGKIWEEKRKEYNRFVTEPLKEDNLEEIRRSLKGEQHYISSRFEYEIQEKLSIKRR